MSTLPIPLALTASVTILSLIAIFNLVVSVFAFAILLYFKTYGIVEAGSAIISFIPLIVVERNVFTIFGFALAKSVLTITALPYNFNP